MSATYHNVTLTINPETKRPSFSYGLTASHIRVSESGFATADEAAFACDKARRLLKPFIRRNRPYNFPDRIQQLSEHELSTISGPVLDAYQMLCSAFPGLATAFSIAEPEPVVVAPEPTEMQVLEERIRIVTTALHQSRKNWDDADELAVKLERFKAISSEPKTLLRLLNSVRIDAVQFEVEHRRLNDQYRVLYAKRAEIGECVDLSAELAKSSVDKTPETCQTSQ